MVPRGPAPVRSCRLPGVALLLSLCALLAAPAGASGPSIYEQRAAYRQALEQLNAGQLGAFRESREALADYALAPYLDYYDIRRQLSALSDAEMRSFQSSRGDLPSARILHHRWLKTLGARRDWDRLLANYRPSADAELSCYHLRALLASGRREEAMAGVPALWITGSSQPKACDPLFDSWIAGGHLTEGQVWERLQLALAANERTLARYLLRFFNGPLKTWAQALYDVHIDPTQVTRSSTLNKDDSYARVVIAHGIRRLARQDPPAAERAWQRYQDSHAFDSAATQALTETVVLALARQGTFPSNAPAAGWASANAAAFSVGMAEAALAAQNWSQLLYWIDQMPAEQRNDLRWQYWLARALARTTLNSERAKRTYLALADERNYYGFLAAEQMGQGIRLNGAAVTEDAELTAALKRLPAVARALELYAVGDLLNARREWNALLPNLDPAKKYHAVQLTAQVGWIPQSILLANAADLWDSLELRFPIAYPALFQRISHATAVSQPFLLAVARQESAFDAAAVSSANARGLMQLMHPTANQVARRIGLAEPAASDLFDPGLNVELGGHHLAKLMQRYQNRRPLAAAAYNAGEGRVDRWIRERRDQPMDVWIETIPFSETRNYVKNVLAFTQVYGKLMDMPAPMLERHETTVN